jgi:hypothetical protein
VAVFALIVLLIWVVGGQADTTQVPAQSSIPALSPWKVELLERETQARDLSIVIGGANQYPFISFTKPDGDNSKIFLAVPALDEPGDFGPGNKWRLIPIDYTTPEVSKVSAAAVHTTQDRFKVGWAYQSGPNGNVHVTEYEFNNQFVNVTKTNLQIINFMNEYPGWDLDAKPSLEFDSSGKPHLAVILHKTTHADKRIVYAYTQSNPPSPCGPYGYQCDSITSDITLTAPVLKLDSNDNPRITYIVRMNNELRYAYPQTNPLFHPNCGPGGDTWRCMMITDGYDEGVLGTWLSLAIGPGAPSIAYTQKDNLLQLRLHNATYVGHGGNCGYDYVLTSINPPKVDLVPRWQCAQLGRYGETPLYIAASIGVDKDKFPVIAYNESDGLVFNLTVTFPAERTGQGATSGNCGPWGNTWQCIKVDGRGINTGKNAALALMDDGRGYTVYIEDEEYSPNLMIAFQQRQLYLPLTMR